MTAIIKICKFTVFSSGSFCQIYRVTDKALIAETMVWPNFFLMNVFFALKGSKPFIIIQQQGIPNLLFYGDLFIDLRKSWESLTSLLFKKTRNEYLPF